jgi:hypothetical protein
MDRLVEHYKTYKGFGVGHGADRLLLETPDDSHG